MRILLVDDDELLTQRLAEFLTSHSYAVDIALDGEAGWDYTQAAIYDLIVLDINLPKLDGVRLCQKLRRSKYNSPILLLTAKGDSSDKVMGLDAGADDYLVKPCTLEELSARIRALLRRPQTAVSPLLKWGGITMDPGTCEVTYQGKLLPLSPKEYGLLDLFLRNPKRVFSSSIILEHLWGFDDAPDKETIRTHVKRLRQKLKAVGLENMIDTVYGMGYRLQPLTATLTATEDQSTEDQSTENQARAAAIALWSKFNAPILERIANIEQAVTALKNGNLSASLRQVAVTNAHKLSGSLGMFGFPEGSRLGKEIEAHLQQATTAAESDQLQTLLAALHQELQRSPQPAETHLPRPIDQPHTTQPSPTLPLPHRPQSSPPEIKILAVDDDPLILKSLQHFLPRWGLGIVTLNNPLELWDTLASEMPDLLILDVDMPQGSGIELCRFIRGNDIWNGIPILFLTAHREAEMIIKMYSAGADDYIAKPFTEPEIITRIFNRLKRNRLLQNWQKPTP